MKIISYCQKECCEVCWNCSCVEMLCEENEIEWSEATEDMIAFAGLTMCPTTLFLQDDVVFITMFGTKHLDEMQELFEGLGWSTKKS